MGCRVHTTWPLTLGPSDRSPGLVRLTPLAAPVSLQFLENAKSALTSEPSSRMLLLPGMTSPVSAHLPSSLRPRVGCHLSREPFPDPQLPPRFLRGPLAHCHPHAWICLFAQQRGSGPGQQGPPSTGGHVPGPLICCGGTMYTQARAAPISTQTTKTRKPFPTVLFSPYPVCPSLPGHPSGKPPPRSLSLLSPHPAS